MLRIVRCALRSLQISMSLATPAHFNPFQHQLHCRPIHLTRTQRTSVADELPTSNRLAHTQYPLHSKYRTFTCVAAY
ncbi:hypothetical protein C7S18_21320 [Ahniella affigens]|uniref:Uncharacterized protein n=1 Tax=Ahniella affigens TaxID=2021234 RepID=A0A2P1PXJ5_9GAMM|nr:hypothetical protein C7S18_21320 [Ahniella affigens]